MSFVLMWNNVGCNRVALEVFGVGFVWAGNGRRLVGSSGLVSCCHHNYLAASLLLAWPWKRSLGSLGHNAATVSFCWVYQLLVKDSKEGFGNSMNSFDDDRRFINGNSFCCCSLYSNLLLGLQVLFLCFYIQPSCSSFSDTPRDGLITWRLFHYQFLSAFIGRSDIR